MKMPNMSLICLILFEINFNASNGTVFWLYVAEITVDKGLGIAILFRMLTLYILSFIALPMMRSIGAEAYFYLWGIF